MINGITAIPLPMEKKPIGNVKEYGLLEDFISNMRNKFSHMKKPYVYEIDGALYALDLSECELKIPTPKEDLEDLMSKVSRRAIHVIFQ